MPESKTKSKAAKTLAKDGTSKAKKQVAAKVLASDHPNQAVAEAAAKEVQSKTRDLVDVVKHVDVPHIADEATEYVAEGAEAVADQFVHVADVSRRLSGRDISLVLLGFTVGAVAGGYVGFRIAEKRLRVKFDELLETETVKVREHYHQKLLAQEAESRKPSSEELAALRLEDEPETDPEGLKVVVEELGYIPPGPTSALIPDTQTPAQIMRDAPESEQMRQVREEGERNVSEITGANGDRSAERAQFVRETQNIFAQRDAEVAAVWDYATEIKSRNPALPYVIHVDEYRENPGEHEQIDLTWYEGDGILAGEGDRIVDDVDEAIGLDNLNRFGHGGADGNEVHIRNEVREIDYDVVRSHGSYAQEVHGFDPEEGELRHSDRSWRGRQTFTDDD
jgi:hypothetical protein